LPPYLLPLDGNPSLLPPTLLGALSSAKGFSGLPKCCGLLLLSSFFLSFLPTTRLTSPDSTGILFSLNAGLFLEVGSGSSFLSEKSSLLWKVLSSGLACDLSSLCSLRWLVSALSLNCFLVSFHHPRSKIQETNKIDYISWTTKSFITHISTSCKEGTGGSKLQKNFFNSQPRFTTKWIEHIITEKNLFSSIKWKKYFTCMTRVNIQIIHIRDSPSRLMTEKITQNTKIIQIQKKRKKETHHLLSFDLSFGQPAQCYLVSLAVIKHA